MDESVCEEVATPGTFLPYSHMPCFTHFGVPSEETEVVDIAQQLARCISRKGHVWQGRVIASPFVSPGVRMDCISALTRLEAAAIVRQLTEST